MTLYVAYNAPHPATTALTVPVSYTTGAKVALQLCIPIPNYIELAGWGISFDEDPTAAAAANNVQVEIASTATATTGLTAHSTTTVKPWRALGQNTVLTMGAAGGEPGNAARGGAITSNTTNQLADRRFVPPTSSFDMIWPSDMRPKFGVAGAAEYVQLRVNPPLTLNCLAYLIWEEL